MDSGRAREVGRDARRRFERDPPQGMTDELATELRSLPEGARYDTVDDLLLAMGIGTAGRIDVPGAPPRSPDSGPPVG